jgi:hypothetical protein
MDDDWLPTDDVPYSDGEGYLGWIESWNTAMVVFPKGGKWKMPFGADGYSSVPKPVFLKPLPPPPLSSRR